MIEDVELDLSERTGSYLQDQRFQGVPILSFGALIELALQAGSRAVASMTALSNIEFGLPPQWGSKRRVVAVCDHSRGVVELSSSDLAYVRRGTDLHLSAMVGGAAPRVGSFDRAKDLAPGERAYADLIGLGYEIGSGARGICACRVSDDAGVAALELGPSAAADTDRYLVHPLSLDAVLHLALLLHRVRRKDDVALPVWIDALAIEGAGAARLCVVQRSAVASTAYDAELLSASGTRLCTVRGLCVDTPGAAAARGRSLARGRMRWLCSRVVGVDRSDPLATGDASSLDLVRLANVLRQQFGTAPPLSSGAFASLEQLVSWYDDPAHLAELRNTVASPLAAPAGASKEMLSAGQQQMWLMHNTLANSACYHVHFRLRWDGAMDRPALERALRSLACHNDALCSVFPVRDGEVARESCDANAIALQSEDLAQMSANERAGRIDAVATEQAWSPFTLDRGPLWRVATLRLGEERYLLLFTFHHILIDGSSVRHFLDALIDHYRSALEGIALPSAPSIRYSEFAAWEQAQLSSGAWQSHIDYWLTRLRCAPRLRLPTDGPRNARRTGYGDEWEIAVDDALLEQLRSLCAREGVSLFVTFTAAWAQLLASYTGQSDLVLGTPASGRYRAELEGMIGLFANSVPIRLHLEGVDTFRQLLHVTRQRLLEALEHQALPFAYVVQALSAERNDGESPVFTAGIVYQGAPTPTRKLDAVDLALEAAAPDGAPKGTSRLDIELALAETSDGLRAAIRYRNDLFRSSSVERIGNQLLRALATAALRPGATLASLSRAEGGELARLTPTACGSTLSCDRGPDLLACIQQRLSANPEAIAIVSAQEVSNAELGARIEACASLLHERGVRPADIVGVCLSSSVDLVVSLLSVMRLGAAYLPLDPSYPFERLALMLRDSSGPRVVTQRALLHRLPADVEAVCLDECDPAGVAAPAYERDPEDLAYVMYTSGSTGQPKGVMVRQRNLTNLLAAVDEIVPVTDESVFLVSTTASFDISVVEMLWTLSRGIRVFLAEGAGGDPRNLLSERVVEGIIGSGATHMQCTPSLARALVSHESGRRLLSSIDYLLLAGEELPCWLAREVDGLVRVSVFNLYGPTETTVWSSWASVRPEMDWSPIGKPVANTTFYVLDTDQRPVARGIAGELWIGGAGVAAGYLNNAGETAARFRPVSPDALGEGRMYRTGDLVRERGDGQFEWLGRLDRQRKLHGNRLELGEVEAILTSSPSVREAVADVREVEGEATLVAYVVPDAPPDEPDPSSQAVQFSDSAADPLVLSSGLRRELVARLSASLPSAAIPSHIVGLRDLPRTRNLKLDYARLPDVAKHVHGAPKVPPRDELEATLAELFAACLDGEEPGVLDSFFDSGGSSLDVMRLVAAATHRDLPIDAPDVIENPTVAELAAIVRRRRAQED